MTDTIKKDNAKKPKVIEFITPLTLVTLPHISFNDKDMIKSILTAALLGVEKITPDAGLAAELFVKSMQDLSKKPTNSIRPNYTFSTREELAYERLNLLSETGLPEDKKYLTDFAKLFLPFFEVVYINPFSIKKSPESKLYARTLSHFQNFYSQNTKVLDQTFNGARCEPKPKETLESCLKRLPTYEQSFAEDLMTGFKENLEYFIKEAAFAPGNESSLNIYKVTR